MTRGTAARLFLFMALGAAACLTLTLAPAAQAQAPRTDIFWARTASAPITLDGILSEPSWAQAESMRIRFPVQSGRPGGGWKYEAGVVPKDSTNATLKLLVQGNQLYLGARIRDKSIGGSKDFNRFDGLLMSLKDHADTNFPKPPTEYFYVWWYPLSTDPQPAGQQPNFIGRWANVDGTLPRTAEQIANWDAVTTVHGITNDDTVNDTDWVVEMRFNLTPLGYDVTKPGGEVIEWNIQIYDCDWFWPVNGTIFSSNRVWWQSPWGNAAWYDEVHLFARPNVTVSSGPLPSIGPEVVIPNGAHYPAPTVDGQLNEQVWAQVAGFDIRYGDKPLRATYPGVGPWRSGQYQPTVWNGTARVRNPADATVKMFFRDHTFYVGFDVRDKFVQYHPAFDRWDGAMVLLNDIEQEFTDHNLMGRRYSFQVAADGTAAARDYLLQAVSEGHAQVALSLKPSSTVDTLGVQLDQGYTAEVSIDLTALSYPTNLSPGTFYVGIDLLDGDSFSNPLPVTDSYGTRTWWFRQYENDCCPAWAFFDPNTSVGVEDPILAQNDGGILVSNYPNPGTRSTIRYTLRARADVKLDVYDIRGRLVEQRSLGVQPAGVQEAYFDGSDKAAGIYLYRLRLIDPETGAQRSAVQGRMVLVK